VLAATAGPALGATATTTMSVSATVANTCVVTASPLAFGTVTGLLSGSTVTATTTLAVTCTNGTAYNVGLGPGQGSSATVSARKMTLTGGTKTLTYSVYQDSSHSQVWGNTVGTDTVSGTGTGLAQTLNVYGQIASGQSTVAVGSYTDTVNVTVTY